MEESGEITEDRAKYEVPNPADKVYEIALSDEQKQLVDAVRNRLHSRHGLDISSLDDMAIMTRVILIKEIMDNKDVSTNQFFQVLDDFGNKFLDLGALVGEMLEVFEGTRHQETKI